MWYYIISKNKFPYWYKQVFKNQETTYIFPEEMKTVSLHCLNELSVTTFSPKNKKKGGKIEKAIYNAETWQGLLIGWDEMGMVFSKTHCPVWWENTRQVFLRDFTNLSGKDSELKGHWSQGQSKRQTRRNMRSHDKGFLGRTWVGQG